MNTRSTPQTITMTDNDAKCTPYYATSYAKAPFEVLSKAYYGTALCYMSMCICCQPGPNSGEMGALPVLVAGMFCSPAIVLQDIALTIACVPPLAVASAIGFFAGGARDIANSCTNPENTPRNNLP